MDYGRYKIIRKIGEGTYAKVFKAFDHQTGQLVALKSFQTLSTAAIRELQTHSKISHINIVQLRDHYQSKTNYILVYDYMHTDLYCFISQIKYPLKEQQLKCFYKMIINAVYQLHSIGILHRDIKTSNFLMTDSYILKLGDMGSATVRSKREVLTINVGTKWYKAPELLLGWKKYSFPADVWSVGCVLAELAALSPIFKGGNDLEQLSMISKLVGDITASEFSEVDIAKIECCEHISLKEMIPWASNDTLSFVDRFLQLNPSKRITIEEAINSDYLKNVEIDDIWKCPIELWKHKQSNLLSFLDDY